MTLVIDQDSRATVASAQAKAALGVGDTALAQEKFAEAGQILEQDMRRAEDEATEHLARFLAATQYYKGGHYRKALQLAEQIQAANLSTGAASLPRFLRDVRERAAPDYLGRVRHELLGFWQAKQYDAIIEKLKDHPYVHSATDLALIRADCCEKTGRHRLAALFYADAIRRSPLDASVLLAPSAPLFSNPANGQLERAWEIIQIQREVLPNAITFAVAAVLLFHRAQQVEGEERKSHYLALAVEFERAREVFVRLPEAVQRDDDVRAVMIVGYDAVAFALHLAGQSERARELLAEAIAFAPNVAKLWTLRGLINYPSEEAIAAFRRAAELGDRSYTPYYFLAHAALIQGDFTASRSWIQEAINRRQGQSPTITAQLHQWQAICLAQVADQRELAEAQFQKAIALDPTNETAQHNYRLFRASHESAHALPNGWQIDLTLPDEEAVRRERLLTEKLGTNGELIEQRLAALAG